MASTAAEQQQFDLPTPVKQYQFPDLQHDFPTLTNTLLLDTAESNPNPTTLDHPPIWVMRQAGERHTALTGHIESNHPTCTDAPNGFHNRPLFARILGRAQGSLLLYSLQNTRTGMRIDNATYKALLGSVGRFHHLLRHLGRPSSHGTGR